MYGTCDVPVKSGLIFHLKSEHGTPTNWRATRGSATVAVPNTGTPTTTVQNGRRGIRTSTAQHYRFDVASPFTDDAVSVYAIIGRASAPGNIWGASRSSAANTRASFNTWLDANGRVAVYTDTTNGRFRSAINNGGQGSTGQIVGISLIYRGPTLQTHYFGSNSTQITDAATGDLAAASAGPTVFFDVGVTTDVNVYEVLIYTGAHDATTRQRVEQYLRFRREGRI